jgi:hypothetical protein
MEKKRLDEETGLGNSIDYLRQVPRATGQQSMDSEKIPDDRRLCGQREETP